MQKQRKLKNGVSVYELEKPVTLVIKTKAPMKWKLIDQETGEEYIGRTPTEQQPNSWRKIDD
mgnify:CR=1 FL=1|tara:strand:+ start:4444 stop:4629 length:186 start_codon:yes stop_codon:yes gene_type:complete